MDDNGTNKDDTFDPARRRLCPDGACVGLIGDDGKCSVCGRTEAQAEAGEAALARDFDDVDARPTGEGASDEGGFDSKRRLCDDGTCVGVIGDDGTCHVCGRRAE